MTAGTIMAARRDGQTLTGRDRGTRDALRPVLQLSWTRILRVKHISYGASISSWFFSVVTCGQTLGLNTEEVDVSRQSVQYHEMVLYKLCINYRVSGPMVERSYNCYLTCSSWGV